jgi:hypothetical protein
MACSSDPAVEPTDSTSAAQTGAGGATSSSASTSSTGQGGTGEGGAGSGGAACEFPAGTTTTPRVRLVYLVPSDRRELPLYTATIEKTLRELSLWYQAHTADGATFEVHDPIVEVIATPHSADWYSTNPTAGSPAYQFWDNARDDAFALTGGMFNDPDNIWIYYIDADNGCGQVGGAGGSGVTILPANDLRGLAGEQNISPCPDDPPDNLPRCRWVGGLGHEIGHAFGLPHPPGCDAGDPSCDTGAIMWTGYATFPNAYLTAADKAWLAKSPFFAPRMLPDCALDCGEP